MTTTPNYADLDGYIWLDGNLIPWADAKVHILSHTLHYGLGVFEGVRAYSTDQGPAIFRLQDHSERLLRSATIMRIKHNFTVDMINEGHKAVLKANKLSSCYLRPIIFAGAEEVGLRTQNLTYHCAVAAWKWGAYLGEENLAKGISALTSTYHRGSVSDGFNRAKVNGGYIANIMALREAQANGGDEAIMLDEANHVCEGSGENIFMVNRGVIYTPPTTSCLDGITRATIMQLAETCGFKVVERPINREELWLADEVFMTGTAAEVTPVSSIDHHTIGSGRRGPVCHQLQSLYLDVVQGKAAQEESWLTLVN